MNRDTFIQQPVFVHLITHPGAYQKSIISYILDDPNHQAAKQTSYNKLKLANETESQGSSESRWLVEYTLPRNKRKVQNGEDLKPAENQVVSRGVMYRKDGDETFDYKALSDSDESSASNHQHLQLLLPLLTFLLTFRVLPHALSTQNIWGVEQMPVLIGTCHLLWALAEVCDCGNWGFLKALPLNDMWQPHWSSPINIVLGWGANSNPNGNPQDEVFINNLRFFSAFLIFQPLLPYLCFLTSASFYFI